MPELDILWEDDDVLAVAKPAWLLVHRGMDKDPDTLVDRVRAYQGGGKVHTLHRLDRQTSGVVLFAKHTDAARAVREQFDTGEVKKTYWAMVRGIAPAQGFIDHPVPRSEKGPRVDAQTAFTRLAKAEIVPRAVSVMECRPVTGRFHQLRRHMSHIDHPILLDANYGPTKLNRAFKEAWGLSRLTLHACELTFVQPSTGERVRVLAPLPESLAGPWLAMGVWPLPATRLDPDR